MPRAKKSKVAASKPAQTQPDTKKTSKHVDATKSAATPLATQAATPAALTPVRRSGRNRLHEPDSTTKDQGSRSSAQPSSAVEEPAKRSRGAAKRGRSARKGTESKKGGLEVSKSSGPLPPASDKRTEQEDSKTIHSVAQTTETKRQSRAKPSSSESRLKKAKSDPKPPNQLGEHKTRDDTVNLGQAAATDRREGTPLRPPTTPSKPSKDPKDLTPEEFEDDTPIPETAEENWDYVDRGKHNNQPDTQNAEDQGHPYFDPREAFNLKWGYLPPLDEEAIRVIDFIIAHPDMAESQKRIQAGSDAFIKGLKDRNVKLSPSHILDPCKHHIQSLDVQTFMSEPKDETTGHEELWKLDQAKITAASSEALFQRTIMVSLVARHFLIYERDSDKKQMFEFSVEETWRCMPMPSRALNNIKKSSDPRVIYAAPSNRFLTQPKPDVAVAFHRQAIMSDKDWETLTEPIQTLVSFEKVNDNNFNIFHFLAIEAKNSEKSLDDGKALQQCSNCASQALFNYYEFFHDAGPKHTALFFEKVRFFSIVTNRTGFLIRIHRAVEVSKVDGGSRVIPTDLNYLLKFEFQELARLEGLDQFSRSAALKTIKKLLKYAKETMCPLIQEATSAICSKLRDPDLDFLISRSYDDVYRHGQPGIVQSSSHAPSMAGTNLSRLARDMGKGNGLGTERSRSDAGGPMETGQITPTQPDYAPRRPSGLKRKFDNSGDVEGTFSEDAHVSKRQETQAAIGLAAE